MRNKRVAVNGEHKGGQSSATVDHINEPPTSTVLFRERVGVY